MTGADDSRLSAAAATLRRRTMESMPDAVKRRLAGPYNRVQEFRADRAFAARSLPDAAPAPDAPDHVVCVVVDALRADAVDAEVAPFLRARTVGSAVTPAPWTFPAVSSLLTGRYPHDHGAMRQSDAADTGATDLTIPPQLGDDAVTLSEAVAGAGYDTYGGFAFHMPFFALSGRFGTHAVYDDADADAVLRDYVDWAVEMRTRVGDAHDRTFAYLHLADLHEPVDPPEPYWERHGVDPDIPSIRRWDYEETPEVGAEGERYRRHRRRLYRAALDYTDDRLAAFRDRLAAELDGDVVLLVTGDHGEAFWENAAFDADHFVDSRPAHCVDHGGAPYESLARVPLAIEGLDGVAPAVAEGGDGTDRTTADADVSVDPGDGRASLVDVAPTLAAAVGVRDVLRSPGYDLTDGVPSDRVPLVEAARYGHEKKAAYLGEWKLLVSRGDDASVGFRLPDEKTADLPEEVERRLLDALPAWPDGEHPDVAVSGMAQQRLEDLGYV